MTVLTDENRLVFDLFRIEKVFCPPVNIGGRQRLWLNHTLFKSLLQRLSLSPSPTKRTLHVGMVHTESHLRQKPLGLLFFLEVIASPLNGVFGEHHEIEHAADDQSEVAGDLLKNRPKELVENV